MKRYLEELILLKQEEKLLYDIKILVETYLLIYSSN